MLRKDFDLLVDVLLKAREYFVYLEFDFKRLIEDIIFFFFEDFSNSETSKRDLHLFMKKLIQVSLDE